MQFNRNAEDVWRKIKESKSGLQKVKEISEDPENEIENWKYPCLKDKHELNWLKSGIGNEYQNYSEGWIR